jgi:multiple sugar transport system substrate-binding protein
MTGGLMTSPRTLRTVCIVLLALLTFLSGCGSAPATTTPTTDVVTEGQAEPTTALPDETANDEPVTIKFMSWQGSVGTVEEIQETLIKPFNAQHPNITVEVEVLPWGEYWTKIQTLVAAGTPPDVYGQSVGYAWDHANKGISLNLQSLFNQDLDQSKFLMRPFDVLRYPDIKGDLYAVPIRWVNSALFYNKTLFDEAGLEYPNENWTFEDMFAAAQKLTKDTDGDGTPDQYGMSARMDHVMLDTIIKANGGEVLNADFTKCQLTQPVAVESIQWVTDLVLKHQVAPKPAPAGQTDAAPTFASGRVAMSIDGSYQIASLQEVTEFDWDITWTPKGTAERVVYGGPDSLSISKQSQHPNAAWEFVKFFLSDDAGIKSIGVGSVPINKTIAESDAWLKSVQKPQNYKVLVDQEPYVVGADFGPSWIEWRAEAMQRELDQALLGTRSVAESATAACTAIDAILARVDR